MTRIYAILAGVAVALLLAGSYLWIQLNTSTDKYAQCRESQVAGGTAAIGGPFTLISQTGATVTDAQVITSPTLVYFGYTFCPDVCPLDNARNAEAVDLLKAAGHDVTPVFITVDPERDTPEVMAEFTGYMHPDMVGLTGSADQVKAASQAYKAYYRKQDSDDPEYYLVDHSTFTYLMFPETGFAEFFRREETAEGMARRVACFIDAANT